MDTENTTHPSEGTTDKACTGLRQRRRYQTSAAITDVALNLFEAKGVDQTTIAEIAQTAAISSRTFFRYFSSKEEAALSGQLAFESATNDLIHNLNPREQILPQLEVLFREVMVGLDDESEGTKRQLVRARRLMREHPGMRARSLRVNEDSDSRLADLINDRADLAGGILEARLIVHTATYALRLAFDQWLRCDAQTHGRSLPVIYDDAREMVRRTIR